MAPDDESLIFNASGCNQCGNKGYKGRMAIMELLRIDSEIDALISRHAHLDELRAAAIRKGYVSLADDGIRLVCDGLTSLAEVKRVVDLSSCIRH